MSHRHGPRTAPITPILVADCGVVAPGGRVRRPRAAPVAALMLLGLVLGPARLGSASVIEYRFRGAVDRLSEPFPRGQHAPRELPSIAVDGAEVRVGDPYEAVISVEEVPPYFSNTLWGRTSTAYNVPADRSTASVTLGGRTFGGTYEGRRLFLSLYDTPEGDLFSGHQVFAPFDPSMNFVHAGFTLNGREGDYFDGIGLPTDLPLPGSEGGTLPDPLFFLDFSLKDQTFTRLSASIESIEVTQRETLPPRAGPIFPGTPVPEPGTFVVFGVVALALAYRRRRPGRGAAIALTALVALGPGSADASEIRYRFRGTVDGLITGDADYAGIRYHEQIEVAGADLRGGAPIEATLVAGLIPPTSVGQDRNGESAQYLYGEGQATFEVAVGGRTFGRSARGDDLSLAVHDLWWGDGFHGHQQLGEVAPSVAWSSARFDLNAPSAFSGTGLPTRLPFSAFVDSSPSASSLGLLLGFEDGTWFELTASFTDIEIIVDDEPTPPGPTGPGTDSGTPVPEPATLAVFVGAILALGWRRGRRRSDAEAGSSVLG